MIEGIETRRVVTATDEYRIEAILHIERKQVIDLQSMSHEEQLRKIKETEDMLGEKILADLKTRFGLVGIKEVKKDAKSK